MGPAGTQCLFSMAHLVVAHGIDDGATALVARRQSIEMTLQVTLDLAFGLGDKAEAGPVAPSAPPGRRCQTSPHTTAD